MYIDWATIRFRYEVLGDSLESLAIEVPTELLERKAREEGWTPNNIDSLVPALQVKPSEDGALEPEAFVRAAKLFLEGAELAKRKALWQEYARLEISLLSKLQRTVDAIDHEDPRAVHALKAAVSTLEGLLKKVEKTDVVSANAPVTNITIGWATSEVSQ